MISKELSRDVWVLQHQQLRLTHLYVFTVLLQLEARSRPIGCQVCVVQETMKYVTCHKDTNMPKEVVNIEDS